jgi:hypothetical protein
MKYIICLLFLISCNLKKSEITCYKGYLFVTDIENGEPKIVYIDGKTVRCK